MREQLLERFEAGGGGSDADYHERSVSGLLIPARLAFVSFASDSARSCRAIFFFVARAPLTTLFTGSSGSDCGAFFGRERSFGSLLLTRFFMVSSQVAGTFPAGAGNVPATFHNHFRFI
jgi:hypothetical protein